MIGFLVHKITNELLTRRNYNLLYYIFGIVKNFRQAGLISFAVKQQKAGIFNFGTRLQLWFSMG
jgi:hypothetical protein